MLSLCSIYINKTIFYINYREKSITLIKIHFYCYDLQLSGFFIRYKFDFNAYTSPSGKIQAFKIVCIVKYRNIMSPFNKFQADLNVKNILKGQVHASNLFELL